MVREGLSVKVVFISRDLMDEKNPSMELVRKKAFLANRLGGGKI